MPKGPAHLRLRADPRVITGPGEPPQGFVVGQTSKDEWMYYWGMAKKTGTPKDPRVPPFTGGETWVYQKPFEGGRRKGGAVIDFIYTGGFPYVAIRIVTERYHIFTDAQQIAIDAIQKERLSSEYIVIDSYSQDWLWDETGEAVCADVARAIKGEQPRVDVFATHRGARIRA